MQMQMQMQNTEALTAGQIETFLEGNAAIGFAGQSRADIYAWTERTLVAQEYHKQGKKQRGVVRAYLRKVTGLSLPQVTRLMRKHRQSGRVAPQAVLRKRFPTKYSEQDVVLLTDECAFNSCDSGPRPRGLERAGNGLRSGAGTCGIRQAGVRAAGGDLIVAHLQPAPKGLVSDYRPLMRMP
jgi:hypothetical protein